MRAIKLIILVIVLILLFGGSFYLAGETVKSHLSSEDNFRNARGDRQFNQSKRLRLTKDNQGQQRAKVNEAPAEVIVMPADTSGVYVIAADMGADASQDGPTDRNEKQPNQSLEKEKPTESEHKSDWEINVLPVQPPDNVKSLPEMNHENKHTPPDRF